MIKKLFKNIFKIINEEKKLIDNIEEKSLILEKGKESSIIVPDFKEIKNLKIKKWHVKEGDLIKEGAILCELENEEALLEFESAFEGVILYIYPTGVIVLPNKEICKIKSI